MLGTGFEGEPREPARTALAAMAACDAPVLAVDVPSGIDATTGEVAGDAVRATATVTFHAAKPGLWISPGKDHAGSVEVVDIGIPDGGPGGADVALIGDGVLDAIPKRAAGSTKFASGAVMVCGGSRGLTGAPCLAAEAAQRTGAGYVTALVPRSLETIFEIRLLEAMTIGLPDDGDELVLDALETILERVQKADALVLGPGFGRGEGAQAVVREAARAVDVPLVLDADGLDRPRRADRRPGGALGSDDPDPARR